MAQTDCCSLNRIGLRNFVLFTPGLLTALFNGVVTTCPPESTSLCEEAEGDVGGGMWVVQTHRGPPLF